MPLVQHSPLPVFQRLREFGHEILPLDRALHQDIRELHIGLLNMMPDAALQATEQQFMRLVGSCNQIAQFYVHPFSIEGLSRSLNTQAYIQQYYHTFAELQEEGLDALIITGANVSRPTLQQEPFWQPLQEVVNWAFENVTSILCSCLATHALVNAFHHIERTPLPQKCWGVYPHRIVYPHHPLLREINTRFDVPHSRWNEIKPEDFQSADLPILVSSSQVGVHIATSPDLFRIIYLQGHPEYDIHSLLKEYKREVTLYLQGEREELPPHPDNYFSPAAATIADRYLGAAIHARDNGQPIPPFPEEMILPHLDNTWGDTGKAIFNNWLGLVYRLTNLDRKKRFMDGVNPNDPLGLRGLDA